MGPPGRPKKLKVNCLVVTVKIMLKRYNVVATIILQIEIYFLLQLCDADFSVILK